jgi:hypothetical protein
VDPDPGGPKTCGSGSATLLSLIVGKKEILKSKDHILFKKV